MTHVTNYLSSFSALEADHAGPIAWTLEFDFGRHSQHVVFGAITHGNETGSLPAMIRMAEALANGEQSYGGKVTLMLGNVAAANENKRFLEADLNRVFLGDAPQSLEKLRAHEMMRVLDTAHLFVDFHQTIEPSQKPFYIFPFHTSGYHWARVLGGAKSLVTRDASHAFSQGCVCADEYARNRGVPGITLEMGQKGFTKMASELTWQTMTRALAAMDQVVQGNSIQSQIEINSSEEFEFIEIEFAQTFGGLRSSLHPGLTNFTWVEAGTTVGKHHDESPMVVPQAGYLLFPKYPNRDAKGEVIGAAPGQIYNLAMPMNEHPATAFKK